MYSSGQKFCCQQQTSIASHSSSIAWLTFTWLLQLLINQTMVCIPHIGLEWEAIEVSCWLQNFCPELYVVRILKPMKRLYPNVFPKPVQAVKNIIHIAKYFLPCTISRRASIPPRPSPGWTPMHIAAERGHGALVKLLVEKGADTEAANNEGKGCGCHW